MVIEHRGLGSNRGGKTDHSEDTDLAAGPAFFELAANDLGLYLFQIGRELVPCILTAMRAMSGCSARARASEGDCLTRGGDVPLRVSSCGFRE